MKTNIFRPKIFFMIFLGNTTMALGIVMFVLPNELMTGGTTGLSLIIDHYLHLPISVFVFIFNCIMFLLGALILGFDFALTTLISTFYYPIALGFSKISLRFPQSRMTGCYPASSADSLSDFHWESSYGAELLPEAWISLR